MAALSQGFRTPEQEDDCMIRLCILAMVLSLLRVAPASPQILIPTVNRPTPVSPANGLYTHDFNAPNTRFEWTQTPFIAGPGIRLPTHFILCLRKIGESDCGHANALMNLPPGSLASSVIRNPPLFTPVGTRYWHTPVIPEDRLDTEVRWQVGACTTLDDASCQFSGNRWITLATMEMQAVSVSGNLLSRTEYEVTGAARNLGSRATRPTRALVNVLKAIYDPSTQGCLRDPNDARVSSDNLVYVADSRGSLTRLVDLPRDAAGNYVATGIIGMYRWGDLYFNSNPPAMVPALPPLAGMPPPLPRTPVATFTIPVPVEGRPFAFINTLFVDYGGAINEVDETNNSIAECEPVF
jgi:hypothetical protein